MPELKKDMRLYHGSYCEVASPDLSKCSRYKDFGRGFYLTSSKEQARNFSKISTYKAMDNGVIPVKKYGVISAFCCADPSFLKIQDYPTAVVAHRRKRTFLQLVRELRHFGIISGKIANDNTNTTITAYMQGVFGDVGSDAADRICISLLLPERLQEQYCFRTEKALDILTFEWSERVWL